MKQAILVLCLIVASGIIAHAQVTTQNARRTPTGSGAPGSGGSAPPVACTSGPPFGTDYTDTSTTPPTIYKCKSGSLTAVAGGTTSAPDNATFITQTPNTTLINEQAMSLLGTGIVKNTTTTGVQSIITPGTGIEAALAVNVGTAGAPVINGGALGTPSSGTGTNITAIPSANISAGALANGMTATTQSQADGSTKLATTNYVDILGATKSGTTAGGDLSGTLPSPTVAKVNGNTPGGTCTNQFARSLSSSAVPTCASITATDLGTTLTPQFARVGLGQAAGASNPLEITAATDATGIKLLNSSQSPVFDIYTSNANAAARNWRITTNFNTFGMMEFIRGTSQGAAPSSTAVTINASGDLGVSTADEATSATAAAFTVAGGAGFSKKIFITGISTSAGLQTAVLCQSSAGEMIADSVACLASSLRYKDRVKPLNAGLKEVLALRPISFHYKPEGIFADNKSFQAEHVGLAAEEVAKVDGRLVGYEKDGITPRTVGYEQIVPLLIKATQELSSKVDADHALITAQQKEITRLRRLVRHR